MAEGGTSPHLQSATDSAVPTPVPTANNPSDPGAPDGEFITLLTSHQRRLYAFILSLVRDPVNADDILQDANLTLWRKWSDFQPGTDFAAWSFAVARFQVMAFRKKIQRSKLVFDDDLVSTLADEAENALTHHDQRRAALTKCLGRLKPDQRDLISRRYQPGACVHDMAQSMGNSPKAVSEMLRRIRKNLQTCIERNLSPTSPS